MRQAFATDPERAEKWLKEEREAGITEHSSLPERITTRKETTMATDTSRGSRGGSRRDNGRGRPASQRTSRQQSHPARSANDGRTNARGSSRPSAARAQRGSARPAQTSGRSTGRTGRSREELREMAKGSGIYQWYRMSSGELEDALGL